MVIKSLSRHRLSIGQLLNYISRDEPTVGPPLLHNLPLPAATDLRAVQAAFQANAAYLPLRKNGVALYHEILSLSGFDQPVVEPAMLLDLGRHYLELRAPQALAYGRVHFDPTLQKNPHLHLVISGNLCGQAKKLRLSKTRFQEVQRQLERYQQERYPQLRHSLVFPDPPPAPEHTGRAEQELKRRRHKERATTTLRKEQLKEHYQAARLQATSARDFRFRLQQAGMEPYFRSGRLAGVTADGRKYRLATLGLADTFAADCQAWEHLPERLGALDELALRQIRGRCREEGFAAALLAVVEQAGTGIATVFRQRLTLLNALRGLAYPSSGERDPR